MVGILVATFVCSAIAIRLVTAAHHEARSLRRELAWVKLTGRCIEKTRLPGHTAPVARFKQDCGRRALVLRVSDSGGETGAKAQSTVPNYQWSMPTGTLLKNRARSGRASSGC